MKKIILIFLFVASGIIMSMAQTATLYGTVTDSTNKGVDGALIGIEGSAIGTFTNQIGKFELLIPAEKKVILVFSYNGIIDTASIKLKDGERTMLNKQLNIRTKELKGVTIIDRSLRDDGTLIKLNPKLVQNIPTPNQSIEDLIKSLPGVSSNNELTSTYNVRGGNFDENLIYVNGIEIYRPFLIRSGQQEGLSFPNPDMVENIKFSAGGFEAKYGDKLSSVLDVSYRKPKDFGGAASASILGGSLTLEGANKSQTIYALAGVRQRSNKYLLNTFETKGEYQPTFLDAQVLLGFNLDSARKWNIELLGNYARNIYEVIPQSRETNFGTINDAKRLTVFFSGRERDTYRNGTGAFTLNFNPSDSLSFKLILSHFATREEENFDLLGQYFLDQLETDLGSDNFGDVAFNLGVGSFLNHARNRLKASISAVEIRSAWYNKYSLVQWGLRYQTEQINDKLSEWNYNDSSGFSIPSTRDSINPILLLNDVIKNKITLNSERISGFIQNSMKLNAEKSISFTAGVRFTYWNLNNELNISPRLTINYDPRWKRKNSFRLATGYYYQPPFYRELRTLEGTINKTVKAQQSLHFVLGNDFTFYGLHREFKLTTEIYYKQLSNLNPYKIDNLRLRYLATNAASGYARGIDLRLYGEFVPGTESWASISILDTREDLTNDFYYIYFNAAGDTIIPGYTFDQRKNDSVRVAPGSIPRPADQRVMFSLFFQDFLPKNPSYKMFLMLHYGTGLPFGPPGNDRYKDILRTTPYRRVDIGFSKQLIGDDSNYKPSKGAFSNIHTAWISLEVFNLLQVKNVSSHIWIQDVTNARQYAVPNFLTQRLINLRLNVRF
ncbi:MAG: hypothetical protein RIQ89_160 [Bacteroidota bacterium]|jgi:hypothetical protein